MSVNYSWQKPLPVGRTSSYTVTVDSTWLGDESIVSQTVTVPSSVTLGTVTTSGNVIQMFLTGVTTGRAEIEVSWTTATRSDCINAFLNIVEC